MTTLESGSRSRYFIQPPFTRDHHRAIIATARANIGVERFEYGWHSSTDEFSSQTHVGRVYDLIEVADDQWQGYTVTSVTLGGESAVISIRVDHLRHIVELDLRAGGQWEADVLAKRFVEEHHLQPAPPEPYRYRRAAVAYSIGAWNREKVADALYDAVTGYFQVERPLIREGYATEDLADQTEKLVSFRSLSEAIAYLRSDAPMAAFRFGIEAPKGVGWGLWINAEHTRLELGSSLPPERIRDSLHSFVGPLKLKPIAPRLGGFGVTDGAPNTPPESPWAKHGVALLIAVIALLSVSGVLSLYRMFTPRYEVHVTAPTRSDSVTLSGVATLLADWYLLPKDASVRGRRDNVPARVRIIRDGTVLFDSVGIRPRSTLPADTGRIEIQILPDGALEPRTVVVINRR